jgi:hypothetical protein
MEDAWRVANAALKIAGIGRGGAEAIRSEMELRINLDRLAETDRHFFESVTGLSE